VPDQDATMDMGEREQGGTVRAQEPGVYEVPGSLPWRVVRVHESRSAVPRSDKPPIFRSRPVRTRRSKRPAEVSSSDYCTLQLSRSSSLSLSNAQNGPTDGGQSIVQRQIIGGLLCLP